MTGDFAREPRSLPQAIPTQFVQRVAAPKLDFPASAVTTPGRTYLGWPRMERRRQATVDGMKQMTSIHVSAQRLLNNPRPPPMTPCNAFVAALLVAVLAAAWVVRTRGLRLHLRRASLHRRCPMRASVPCRGAGRLAGGPSAALPERRVVLLPSVSAGLLPSGARRGVQRRSVGGGGATAAASLGWDHLCRQDFSRRGADPGVLGPDRGRFLWGAGDGGALIHWDGESWARVCSPTQKSLNSLSGTAHDDLWATGSGVLLHFDGRAWATVELPAFHQLPQRCARPRPG